MTNIRKTLNHLIKLVILFIAYTYVYKQVFVQKNIPEMLMDFRTTFHFDLTLFFLAFSGLILNYGIEAYKWRRMIIKLEYITYYRCVGAVLAGLTLSLFSPNRIGEFLGRIFMLEKANRIDSSIVTIATSIGQLLITLIAGVAALWIYPYFNEGFSEFIHNKPFILVYILPASLIIIGLLLYVNLHKMHLLGAKLHLTGESPHLLIISKIHSKLKILDQYKSKDWLVILALCFCRYIVFSSQFVLLLEAFIPDFPLVEAYLLISIIFMSLTVIPAISLAEIGIRGSVSIFVFGFYFREHLIDPQSQALSVISVSTLLWLMNIVFPALIGSFSVLHLKFFRR